MKKSKIWLFFPLLLTIILLNAPSPVTHAISSWEMIYYDDGAADSYLTLPINDSVAVRFNPPAITFKLSGMMIYSNSTNVTQIRVWVLDANFQMIMNPICPLLDLGLIPPYDISFGDDGPIFTPTNVSVFYIVLQWYNTTSPFGIGIDESTPPQYSYTNISGIWQAYSTGHIMIRARIEDINGPTFDYIPLTWGIAGHDLSISVQIMDEFGVEAVTLAYRTLDSENTSFAYVSLRLASGTPLQGIWYGSIPGANVTFSGVEYYIWATDVGFNQKYYGNATTPFKIQVTTLFEMPPYIGVVIIVCILAAAIVLYPLLPKYEGGDTS
ncbi:MAG: hypothetical protein ACTSRS_15200 [Candidatus Helarchaeota archaeon]